MAKTDDTDDGFLLQWPRGRGYFAEGDGDRSPTGEEEFRPGRVVEIADRDVRDHYIDRGWKVVDREDIDDDQLDPEAVSWPEYINPSYRERVRMIESGLADHLLHRIQREDNDIYAVREAVEDRLAELDETEVE